MHLVGPNIQFSLFSPFIYINGILPAWNKLHSMTYNPYYLLTLSNLRLLPSIHDAFFPIHLVHTPLSTLHALVITIFFAVWISIFPTKKMKFENLLYFIIRPNFCLFLFWWYVCVWILFVLAFACHSILTHVVTPLLLLFFAFVFLEL